MRLEIRDIIPEATPPLESFTVEVSVELPWSETRNITLGPFLGGEQEELLLSILATLERSRTQREIVQEVGDPEDKFLGDVRFNVVLDYHVLYYDSHSRKHKVAIIND